MSAPQHVRLNLVSGTIPDVNAYAVVAFSPLHRLLAVALSAHADPTMRAAKSRTEAFAASVPLEMLHDAWLCLATLHPPPADVIAFVPEFSFFFGDTLNDLHKVEATPATRAAVAVMLMATRDLTVPPEFHEVLARTETSGEVYGPEGKHVYLDYDTEEMLKNVRLKLRTDGDARAAFAKAANNYLKEVFAQAPVAV